MKTHQHRAVSPVAIAQQIPANVRFAQFAVEAQACGNLLSCGLLAVDGIGNRVWPASDDFGDNGITGVGGQHQGTWLGRGVAAINI
jgi:hypothetical protein